jgi:hypothetical protein
VSTYRIVVTGWHANTIADLELTDKEAAVAQKLADAVTAVSNWAAGWQPSMYLKPHSDPQVQQELAIEAERRRPETEMPF